MSSNGKTRKRANGRLITMHSRERPERMHTGAPRIMGCPRSLPGNFDRL